MQLSFKKDTTRSLFERVGEILTRKNYFEGERRREENLKISRLLPINVDALSQSSYFFF
jgi:hypothetical protein